MAFRISALPADTFEDLFSLDEDELRRRGGRRYVADTALGFPCRVSLEDAAPGETLILVPYVHQPADSPYHASGPVFVRQAAGQARPAVNEVPALLRLRPLSLRAYDDGGLMVAADVVDGRAVEGAIERLFADSQASYLHVHYAKPGCYACRVDRA
jgi:hypothetical protein